MSGPKNNLAQQLEKLQKDQEAKMKRKRLSDSVLSASKRSNFGTSGFTPCTPQPSRASDPPPPRTSNLRAQSSKPVLFGSGLGNESSRSSGKLKSDATKFIQTTLGRKKPPDKNITSESNQPIDLTIDDFTSDDDFEITFQPSQLKKTPKSKSKNKSIFDSDDDDELGLPAFEENTKSEKNNFIKFEETTQVKSVPVLKDEEITFLSESPPKKRSPKKVPGMKSAGQSSLDWIPKEESLTQNMAQAAKDSIFLVKEEKLTHKKQQQKKKSIFDSDVDYLLNETDTTKPVKEEKKSFLETVESFNLLTDSEISTSTQKVSSNSTPIIREGVSMKRTLSSKSMLSPEKNPGVMNKVQPSKSVKKIANTSDDLKDEPKDGRCSPLVTRDEYLHVLEEICELVGDGIQPFKPDLLRKLQALQRKRLQLQSTRNASFQTDKPTTSDCVFKRSPPRMNFDESFVPLESPNDAPHEYSPPQVRYDFPEGEDYLEHLRDEEEFIDPPQNNDFTEENDEEDLFSDDDIDDDVITRAAEESLAASQASKLAASQEDSWNSIAKMQPSANADSSFTATQLIHSNKLISDHIELARTDFPFSRKLLEGFKKVFGMKRFRKNQLECMNATLLGQDCFVLMPTGGGKSLCYQLPALIKDGITIVVSPLKSLIQDQVQKLVQLGIPASHLSGQIGAEQALNVYRDLNSRVPQLKLLYVTPEKIGCSTQLKDCFQSLYQRGMLNRFVIDEAHCVSQWGHDFRPDYAKLQMLRSSYPSVPIMALTATAAPRVRADILHNLSLRQAKVFITSFNRSNLKYILLPKPRKIDFEGVLALITRSYKLQSGIVYCLSRKDCEQCADFLKKNGVKAMAYHAGLTDIIRSHTQKSWIEDEINIVCATIAFGMGIDKHDVRFVIHHTLPKSVEGFYQESGRAGRDGDPADCIVLYNYCDVARNKNLIMSDDSAGHQKMRQIHLDNLNYIIQFCENRMDCRRTQLLSYFGEEFSAEECRALPRSSCDNCSARGKYALKDLTQEAIIATKLVQGFGSRGKFTLIHCIEVLRGAVTKKVEQVGHNRNPMFGKLKGQPKTEIERLMRKLLLENILQESISVGYHGMVVSYILPGRKSFELTSGKRKVMMDVEVKQRRDVAHTSTSDRSEAVEKVVKCCYDALVELRKKISIEKKINIHNILPTETLHEMSEVRPHSPQQMLTVTGVTQIKLDFYGDQFLALLKNFPVGRPRDNSDFSERPGPSSKWVNTGGPAPRGVAKVNSWGTKERSVARKRVAKSTPPPPPPAPPRNVGLMPMPAPRKPNAASPHRRL